MINSTEAQGYAMLAVTKEVLARMKDITIAAKMGHLKVILKNDVSPAAKLQLECQGFTVRDSNRSGKSSISW
jgi:hypothetical protein